jgi:hypothetical protein
MKGLSFFLFLVLLPIFALAQALPGSVDGQVDYFAILAQMIANPKAFKAVFIGAFIIIGIVQAMKSKFLGQFFKFIPAQIQFAIISLLGLAYGFIVHVFIIKDQDVSVAVIGIITSGSAVAVFNAFKLIFEKKKA